MARYLVTGGNGFLGKALRRNLESKGHEVTCTGSPPYFDLTKKAVLDVFLYSDPDVVIHLAAKVGGIGANQASPAEFWHDNLLMGIHVLESCRLNQVKKVVMIGTTCSYPKEPKTVPFVESEIFDGFPEPTNAAYGIAKRCLIEGARSFRDQYGLNAITVIPTNLYGPGDNDNPKTSHVIAAIMRKVKVAILEGRDKVEIWGTGKATRDFLYVDDAAEAIFLASEKYDGPIPVNLGSGQEIAISDLVEIIKDVSGWKGTFIYDRSKPDGQPRRVLDTTLARQSFGWQAATPLREGLAKTWESLK
jgi:GDP-L-fucose synthase